MTPKPRLYFLSAGDTYDAIVLALFEGPHSRTDVKGDPFYGSKALERTRNALTPGGVVGVWSEAPDESFRRRLEAQRFRTETHLDITIDEPGRRKNLGSKPGRQPSQTPARR